MPITILKCRAGDAAPCRYLYLRLVDRSLISAASIDTQVSAINTHAARPVYQMRASIMNATPPLTSAGRPRQHLPESRQLWDSMAAFLLRICVRSRLPSKP